MPSIPLQIPRLPQKFRLPQKLQIGTYVTQLPKGVFRQDFFDAVLAEKLVLRFELNFDPPRNDRGPLKVQDWADICRLHRAEGTAIRAIARRWRSRRSR